MVRYIHLNPLRAGLVQNLGQLDRYPWSGHGVLTGKVKYSWQDADYVLSWFGKRAGQARRIYRRFVSEGIRQGHRPELVGGGLIRSLGGWSAVLVELNKKTLPRIRQQLLPSDNYIMVYSRNDYGLFRPFELVGFVVTLGEEARPVVCPREIQLAAL